MNADPQTDLLHLRPEHAAQTIDIIGSGGGIRKCVVPRFSKLSIDFQADAAILCGPDLIPFAILGESAGA